ncbi:MAG: hypothetical protein EXR75_07745 [Myxococcales bacterium]|nr:hypothetical protein [Myxococcales bacterium]
MIGEGQGAGGAATGGDDSGVGGTVGVAGPGSTGGPGSGGADNGSGPASGTASASGPTSGTGGTTVVCQDLGDKCTACVANACAETWCGCAANSDCLPLFECFGNCAGEQTCNQKCLSAYPNGIADVLLVSGCAGTTCDPSCNWGESDFGACEACVFTDCKTETNACLGEPACFALWECLGGCAPGSLTCQQACYTSYGDGTKKLESWLTCSGVKCKKECP